MAGGASGERRGVLFSLALEGNTEGHRVTRGALFSALPRTPDGSQTFGVEEDGPQRKEGNEETEERKTREKGKILRNRERRGRDVEMGESTEAHQPNRAGNQPKSRRDLLVRPPLGQCPDSE